MPKYKELIQENNCENVLCKMSAVLPHHLYVSAFNRLYQRSGHCVFVVDILFTGGIAPSEVLGVPGSSPYITLNLYLIDKGSVRWHLCRRIFIVRSLNICAGHSIIYNSFTIYNTYLMQTPVTSTPTKKRPLLKKKPLPLCKPALFIPGTRVMEDSSSPLISIAYDFWTTFHPA